jgi:hypothetical protein
VCEVAASLTSKGQGNPAIFGYLAESGEPLERPSPREVHLIVIGPNGRELEAGPLGPPEDKPAGGDLGAWLYSPHTPGD